MICFFGVLVEYLVKILDLNNVVVKKECHLVWSSVPLARTSPSRRILCDRSRMTAAKRTFTSGAFRSRRRRSVLKAYNLLSSMFGEAATSLLFNKTGTSSKPPRQQPMNWQAREDSLNDRQFLARYRMSKAAFHELVRLCRPYLPVRRKARADSVTPEVALSMTLRWLAGGSYLDICDVHNVRESCFFVTKSRTLEAMKKGLKAEIRFPETEEERAKVAAGFAAYSNGALRGCLSSLDGLAVQIHEPTKKDTPNPAGFKNRKGFFAILVQAMCDSDRLFTYVSVNHQGSCHDSTAFDSCPFSCGLADLVPSGYWIAADDAYGCTEKIITPHPGSHEHHSPKDSFNFWQSSAQRIYIECTFGILVRRWGVLWRPLECRLKENCSTIYVCMLLHNFCSRRGAHVVMCREEGEVDAAGGAPDVFLQNELHMETQTGRRRDLESSILRAELTAGLHAGGFRRPNVNRRPASS